MRTRACPHARTRVRVHILLTNMRPVDMRVNLSSGQIGVPEDLLNHAQISASFEHMRGKRVPERMRMQVAYPHALTCFGDDPVNALPRQTPSAGIDENRVR